MAHIKELVPVVIDPRHERFGQVGEITFSGQYGDGTCLIKFEDEVVESLNDGWVSGITQFVALPVNKTELIERLADSLPNLQLQLEKYYDQIVDPMKQPPTPETVAARVGAIAIINSVINPAPIVE